MLQGYVKIWRKLVEHDIWLKKKFTDGQAWADLILLANHKKGWIEPRGIRMEIKRGQVGWSEISLSKRWKWSREKTHKFIGFLSQQNMVEIEQQKNHITTILTIINYGKWQDPPTTESDEKPATNHTTNQTTNHTTNLTTDLTLTRSKEVKEEKEDINTVQILPVVKPTKQAWNNLERFDKFWSVWPKKVGKQDAHIAFVNARVDDELLEKMVASVKLHLSTGRWKTDTAKNKNFILDPKNWINGKRWEDDISEGTARRFDPGAGVGRLSYQLQGAK